MKRVVGLHRIWMFMALYAAILAVAALMSCANPNDKWPAKGDSESVNQNLCRASVEFCTGADQVYYKPASSEAYCFWFCPYTSQAGRVLYVLNGNPVKDSTFPCSQ